MRTSKKLPTKKDLQSVIKQCNSLKSLLKKSMKEHVLTMKECDRAIERTKRDLKNGNYS